MNRENLRIFFLSTSSLNLKFFEKFKSLREIKWDQLQVASLTFTCPYLQSAPLFNRDILPAEACITSFQITEDGDKKPVNTSSSHFDIDTKPFDSTSNTQESTLTINKVMVKDSGSYECMWETEMLNVSATMVLAVRSKKILHQNACSPCSSVRHFIMRLFSAIYAKILELEVSPEVMIEIKYCSFGGRRGSVLQYRWRNLPVV